MALNPVKVYYTSPCLLLPLCCTVQERQTLSDRILCTVLTAVLHGNVGHNKGTIACKQYVNWSWSWGAAALTENRNFNAKWGTPGAYSYGDVYYSRNLVYVESLRLCREVVLIKKPLLWTDQQQQQQQQNRSSIEPRLWWWWWKAADWKELHKVSKNKLNTEKRYTFEEDISRWWANDDSASPRYWMDESSWWEQLISRRSRQWQREMMSEHVRDVNDGMGWEINVRPETGR